jgi:hypothetical protein
MGFRFLITNSVDQKWISGVGSILFGVGVNVVVGVVVVVVVTG